jgi:hypothetical protein
MTSTSAGTDSAQTSQTAPAVRRSRGFTSARLPLLLAGVCFALYPALRPFSDEKSLNGARAFASSRWVVARSLGIAAFILLAVGLFAVYEHIQDTTARRTSRAGLLLSWIGVGLVLPYYGAEVFGLHAAGLQALTSSDTGTFDTLIHAIRWEAGLWFIIAGLLLLAAGAITFAVAVWRSAALPRWYAIPLAVLTALYIPQFAASQPIRVTYGILLASACLILAWAARSASVTTPQTSRRPA